MEGESVGMRYTNMMTIGMKIQKNLDVVEIANGFLEVVLYILIVKL